MADVWRSYKVAELLERVRRPLPVVSGAAYRQIGLRSFGKGFFHKPVATAEDIGKKRLFTIEPGDLVFNIVFAWEGAVALAGPAEQGVCGSHRFPTYRPRAEYWLPRYAELFFQGPVGVALLRDASPGSAGRNKTLNQQRLAGFTATIPPLDTQRAFVDLVDAMDAGIEANERVEAAMARLVGGLREDMVERQEYEAVELGSLLDGIEGGRSPRAQERLPEPGERAVLKVSAVKPGYFDASEVKTLTPETVMPDRARLRDGDLLITRANTAILVGAVCLVAEAPEGYFLCDKTLRMRPDGRLRKDYAVHALGTPRVRARIERVATGSSASMKNISQEKIRALRVALPPLEEQERIAGVLNQASDALAALRAKLAALRALRTRLLQSLANPEAGGESALPWAA